MNMDEKDKTPNINNEENVDSHKKEIEEKAM